MIPMFLVLDSASFSARSLVAFPYARTPGQSTNRVATNLLHFNIPWKVNGEGGLNAMIDVDVG